MSTFGTNSILGISMDCNSYPSIYPRPEDSEKHRSLGVAQYPQNNPHASVLNNIKYTEKGDLDKALYFGKKAGSVIFVCSYCESDLPTDPKNILPLRRSFANLDWVFTCSCQLAESVTQDLALEKGALFSPLGVSVEEHIFCWLLGKICAKNVSSLDDFDKKELHRLFGLINGFGSIDILLSDGQNLVVYRDQKGVMPFWGVQSFPPHEEKNFIFDRMGIEIDALDRNHALIAFANQNIFSHSKHIITVIPGQMLVIRHAEVIYDTHMNILIQKNGLETSTTQDEAISKPQKGGNFDGHFTLSEVYHFPLSIDAQAEHASDDSKYCVYSLNRKERPILYSISHTSIYEYDAPIYQSKHLFRLQPVHDFRQTVLKYRLTNSVPGRCYNFSGVFGNSSTMFDVMEPYEKMVIHSESIVSVNETPPQTRDLLYQQTTVPLIWMPWDRIMLQAYLVPPELPESQLFELSEYAMSFVKINNYRIMNIMNDINNTIYREFKYVPSSTTLSTTPYEVFITRKGVCQDFANLFICLARLLNVPARYRVGYIYTGTDYEKHMMSDASHAWVELYLPNIGWLGFDPTNGCVETNMHIKVACGRNYLDATPTSGTIYKGGGGMEGFMIAVQVKRIGTADPSTI